MDELEWLADRFEESRGHLRAVAYRMLGSTAEADDAVQECWLRLSRSHKRDITNLQGWLTTVVGRVCLDMLRQRRSRREDSLEELVPAVATFYEDEDSPEEHALLADSVGLALLVVLESLDPAERLAFVLHDLFGVPFDEVAPIVERTPAAARQLASRARRRVRGEAPAADSDTTQRREIVEAFLAAARDGDLDGLVAVLDPDAVGRSNGLQVARGALAVARGAATFAPFAQAAQLALINGSPGVLAQQADGGSRAMTFEISGGKILEVDVISDLEQLRHLELARLD
ncbi:sigma-70 family RNA polymerase sigma factor [Streptomyces olivochromogenes]|uniref:sigma-70 family RNA polymerase sigma factor n=1 Tax=Streptomyces olivochromogenes TaxID=1963 RepID=UPI001F41BBED|nr:sigma-70 family RNA polymerase sigma factor [Streptomyces olivochromogenes]MCF3131243.1 sigma-70 family RNA polymerase sigma factor [Streptomyces olivochromogenes]